MTFLKIAISILKIAIGIFVLLFLLAWCSIFFYKETEDLGNCFSYDEKRKDILGNFECNSRIQGEIIDIPPTVISYAYDKHFIVAKQKPEKFHDVIYSDGAKYVYSLGRDTVYYWLIIKQERKVLGPLDYNSFLQLTKEHEVPYKLMTTLDKISIDERRLTPVGNENSIQEQNLVVKDINLNIIRGDTSSFPGGCMDGRQTSSGWLLTDTDTLCWACNDFFLKKNEKPRIFTP